MKKKLHDMKKELNKVLLVSSLVCLIPLVIGVILWNVLPDGAMRQISGNQQGPGWTKEFLVVGIPVFFMLIHLYICLIKPKRARPVSKKIMYWTNPIISNLCFIVLSVLSFMWAV